MREDRDEAHLEDDQADNDQQNNKHVRRNAVLHQRAAARSVRARVAGRLQVTGAGVTAAVELHT